MRCATLLFYSLVFVKLNSLIVQFFGIVTIMCFFIFAIFHIYCELCIIYVNQNHTHQVGTYSLSLKVFNIFVVYGSTEKDE